MRARDLIVLAGLPALFAAACDPVPNAPHPAPRLGVADDAVVLESLSFGDFVRDAYLEQFTTPACHEARNTRRRTRHVSARLPDGSYFNLRIVPSRDGNSILTTEATRGYSDGGKVRVVYFEREGRLVVTSHQAGAGVTERREIHPGGPVASQVGNLRDKALALSC